MSIRSEQLRLRLYLAIFAAVMLLGPVGFMATEGLSLIDALYFTVVTIATVGYGDISPATGAGKVLAVILIVGGVGTFLGVVANATELFLSRREQQARRQKLNMVIGLFFSECGGSLLRCCAHADPAVDVVADRLVVRDAWTGGDFARVRSELADFPLEVDTAQVDYAALCQLLNDNGPLFVRLLENPYMLEHEAFTDLLVAVLHLKEELLLRPAFDELPESDRQHLCGDIRRVYRMLVERWLDYMEHLQGHYPFLFSLAMRTNPFDRGASPIVR